MIAYVDGKPRRFVLFNGARVFDDTAGMHRLSPPEGDGRRTNGRGKPLPWAPHKKSTRHKGETR
jgi:hypothetical protein